MSYTATLIHNCDYVRIYDDPDTTITSLSFIAESISTVPDAKGRPGKADAVLKNLGYERLQPWKNLSWGLKASVIKIPNNNQPNKGP